MTPGALVQQQGLHLCEMDALAMDLKHDPVLCVHVACVQVLLNPPRAVLQARLEARAAAGAHFMPASLLESQLQQLQVTDPTELHMCFGCLPGESSCDCSSTEFPTAESIVAAIMSRHHSHSSSADA